MHTSAEKVLVNLKEETPPNIEEIYRTFPALRGNPRLIVTYYPKIYTEAPGLPPALLLHEETHLRQQESSPEQWWYQYLRDADFRLSQEIEAYANQYAWYEGFPNRIKREVLRLMAGDLASEFYGNIISFGEAESRIKRYAKTLKTDTDPDPTSPPGV